MGSLQTFFYLALVSAIMIGLALTLSGIIVAGLRRWFRQRHHESVVTFWLVGAATTLVLVLFILGTAGVLYGFIRYGAS